MYTLAPLTRDQLKLNISVPMHSHCHVPLHSLLQKGFIEQKRCTRKTFTGRIETQSILE